MERSSNSSQRIIPLRCSRHGVGVISSFTISRREYRKLVNGRSPNMTSSSARTQLKQFALLQSLLQEQMPLRPDFEWQSISKLEEASLPVLELPGVEKMPSPSPSFVQSALTATGRWTRSISLCPCCGDSLPTRMSGSSDKTSFTTHSISSIFYGSNHIYFTIQCSRTMSAGLVEAIPTKRGKRSLKEALRKRDSHTSVHCTVNIIGTGKMRESYGRRGWGKSSYGYITVQTA